MHTSGQIENSRRLAERFLISDHSGNTEEAAMESGTVQTVLGPVPVGQLGTTLMHEHVLLGYPGWDQDSLYSVAREQVIDSVVRPLKRLAAQGVKTLVDCTPMELGRDPEVLRTAAEAAGLHIIGATGFYHGGVGFPAYWRMMSVDQLAETLVHEIESGMGHTAVRPGILKVGTRANGITPNEERALRGAARAAKASGLRVTTHTEEGKMGPEQLDIFESEGLPLNRVIVGHMDGSTDLDVHRALMRRGAFIGIDQIGYQFRRTDAVRVDIVSALVSDGFAPQLIISQDRVGLWRGRLTPFFQQFQDLMEIEGFNYLIDTFVPMLREAGVQDPAIHQMLVENPARYFGGE
jgi:phosphotriesterase-related protein